MDLNQVCRVFVFEHPPTLRGDDGELLAPPTGQRRFELPRPTLKDVELPFMRHRERQSREGVERTFELGTPGYKAAMEVLVAGFDTGAYRWKSRRFFESLTDATNVKELLYLWFRQADKTVTRELIAQMWEERAVELDALLTEMLTEKNSSGPADAGMTSRSAPSSAAGPSA